MTKRSKSDNSLSTEIGNKYLIISISTYDLSITQKLPRSASFPTSPVVERLSRERGPRIGPCTGAGDGVGAGVGAETGPWSDLGVVLEVVLWVVLGVVLRVVLGIILSVGLGLGVDVGVGEVDEEVVDIG